MTWRRENLAYTGTRTRPLAVQSAASCYAHCAIPAPIYEYPVSSTRCANSELISFVVMPRICTLYLTFRFVWRFYFVTHCYLYFTIRLILNGRSQWPRGLRHELFARSDTGIVGSNPTQGMDVCVCVYSVCVVLCVGSGLATGLSLVQEVLPSV
jgi:hypothetical protein